MSERPLRIALMGTRGIPATYSGFETFYEQLAVRLAKRGHDVTVYNRAHHVQYPETHYCGVRLVTLPGIRGKHLDTFSHTLVSMLHAVPKRYDIYYLCIVGNSPMALLPKLVGRPVVLNVDGADAEREKWGGAAKFYIRASEKIATLLADVIIADSRVIKRRYRELYGHESVFIPYGAEPRPRAEAPPSSGLLERFGLTPDGYVLFVSRLTPENQAHLLIEAFERSGVDLKLAIVGDAPYTEEYKSSLRARCSDRVVMTGYLFGDHYREISQNCRFFVLPSGIDGTRPVLLDQMGFGSCIVVRDTEANLEVIGDAGLSFENARPVESLAELISRLATEPDLVATLGAKALERVRSIYSWDGITDQYEALFRDLTTRSKS